MDVRRTFLIVDLVLLIAAVILTGLSYFGVMHDRELFMGIAGWAMIHDQGAVLYNGTETGLKIFTNLWGVIVVPTDFDDDPGGGGDSTICDANQDQYDLCHGTSWVTLSDEYEMGSPLAFNNFTFGDFATHSCKISSQNARTTLEVACALSVLLLISRITCHWRFARKFDYRKKCTLLLANGIMLAVALGPPLYYWEGCLREIDLSLGRLTDQSNSVFQNAFVTWYYGYNFSIAASCCYAMSFVLHFTLQGSEESPKELGGLLAGKPPGYGSYEE